jgi:glucan phosphoethanolaminetransferase (alkaline phosphatase superfamily)
MSLLSDATPEQTSTIGTRLTQRIKVFIDRIVQLARPRLQFWMRLFTLTILACYLYVLMEWIFFATMPSFMAILPFLTKVEIFLISGFGMALISLVLLVGIIILDIIASYFNLTKITSLLAALLPTVILSALLLLLLDNFTYTLLKFGISTSTGFARLVYALMYIAIFIYVYYQILRFFSVARAHSPSGSTDKRMFLATMAILGISFGLAAVKLDYQSLFKADATVSSTQASRLPNIILLGSDGLEANNLSAYGYKRDTTPQLAELAKSSLVAENTFTNAGNTAGSVISILTSKLPTQTRVLYPPNILTGEDAYQHLPGILKELGYKAIEYGVPFYVDAYNYNLQTGFDIVNNRTLRVGKLGELSRKLGYDYEVYFSSRLLWRISERLLHILFIQEMKNPFDIVTQAVPNISDREKVDQLLAALDHADSPIFIHAHLLGTHGGYYDPPDQMFSIGKSQTRPWMDDFYDDTLRAFDAYVGQVVYHLKKNGQLDNTILIIYTDHNRDFKVNQRIPLIIHFPKGEYAGRLTTNAQNLDIAPTVLDYLGVAQPVWMDGSSLLNNRANQRHLIFSAGTNETKLNEYEIFFLDERLNQPPFYQFSYIGVVDCHKWYHFDLTTYHWSYGEVTGYVVPCKQEELAGLLEIKQAVYDRMTADGFDISSLP